MTQESGTGDLINGDSYKVANVAILFIKYHYLILLGTPVILVSALL